MGYAVIFHTLIEVHNFHRLNSSFHEVDLSRGTSRRASSPSICSDETQSHLHCVGNYGSGATTILVRKEKQLGVYPDNVSKVEHKDFSLDGNNTRVEKKANGIHQSSNHLYSSKSFARGPFAKNDEKTNNDILRWFCNHVKLLNAIKLLDVMTRRNQIPYFPSCFKLFQGLISVEHTEKASKVLQIMVMYGGVPDIFTYNLLIWGLCRKGHFNGAIDVLENMSLSGCLTHVITFNTIVRSMFDHGKLDHAIQFWKDQLSDALHI